MLLNYVLLLVKIVIRLHHYYQWGEKKISQEPLSLQKTQAITQNPLCLTYLFLRERAPHGRMCHVNFSVSNVASSRNVILPLFFSTACLETVYAAHLNQCFPNFQTTPTKPNKKNQANSCLTLFLNDMLPYLSAQVLSVNLCCFFFLFAVLLILGAEVSDEDLL